MSNRTLLERQRSLLAYLTDPARFDAGPPVDPDLAGLDIAGLRVNAELSLGKRMEKIRGVFEGTFAVLRDAGDIVALAREFASAHPPLSSARYDNACQFYDYLEGLWADVSPEPAYLPDLARFELTLADLRRRVDDEDETDDGVLAEMTVPDRSAIRRSPSVALLDCGFDIRPIVETGTLDIEPEIRHMHLVLQCVAGDLRPRAFELAEPVFELLEALDDWVLLPRTSDADTDCSDEFDENAALESLIQQLAERGLIEIAP